MRGLLTLLMLCAFGAPAFADEPLRAIVTKRVVYPGETIMPADLRDVAVRNKRAVAKPVARRMAQVVGLVAARTLLPKRYIALSALRPPHLVEAGKSVRVKYRQNGLAITLKGDALQAGALGAVVAVRNPASGRTLSGIVEADGSVTVRLP